ncbi:uncharacterized protein H6S33_003793 [Morchella sextelata]|uniref:uncharacterized protein n=1 Tax=Morchella sextelata TaxID=1174677 RepID=UPI001D0517C8|nr:uncharacterized protein H6S33_003793 [Morchella sextelata]KAH0606132.1 hypothetical protein H6S33_003793 [Morchella sextelata]
MPIKDDYVCKPATGVRFNGSKPSYCGPSYPEPVFSFNSALSPPTFAPESIMRVLINSIDALPFSECGSIKHKLLVEELCTFVEDIDSIHYDRGGESLRSKLMKLVDGFNHWAPKPPMRSFKLKSIIGPPGVHAVIEAPSDLSRPLVFYYPLKGEISIEKAFFTIGSAAYPVRYESVWKALTDSKAEDIWKLYKAAEQILVGEARESSKTRPYICRKEKLLLDLHHRGLSLNVEPIWTGFEEQFLNTCTSLRSIQTTIERSDEFLPESCYKFDFENCGGWEAYRFCRFMRQIVVPIEQTVGIISGEKVAIKPLLWDPHQNYDSLRKKTTWGLYPTYLEWDENTESFTGAIKLASNFPERTHVDVRCDIYSRTSETLPGGVRFETILKSFITLRVYVPAYKAPGATPTKRLDDSLLPVDEYEKNSTLDQIVQHKAYKFLQSSSHVPMKLTVFGAQDEQTSVLSEHGSSRIDHDKQIPICPVISGGYGGTSPMFKQRKIKHESEGILSLRWDPEQWLSIIFRVEPEGGVEWRSISNWEVMSEKSESDLSESDDSVEKDEESLENNLEQIQYVGYPVCARKLKCRSGYQVYEDISAIFNELPSVKVQSIVTNKPSSFGSAIFSADAEMKDRMLENENFFEGHGYLGLGIEKQRCIQWRKLTLPKILRSLRTFHDDIEDVITISVHIGKKGGYNLQEVKRIAKAIIIFGDLFDYTKIMRDESEQPMSPDFGSSRHNPYSQGFTTVEQVDLIDKATSLSDVTKIMNPEYHDVEEYRFNFSKLKSQGTIVWTHSISKTVIDGSTGLIAGMLSISTAAMSLEDACFAELAKHEATWDNLSLLLENDKKGIARLSLNTDENNTPRAQN